MVDFNKHLENATAPGTVGDIALKQAKGGKKANMFEVLDLHIDDDEKNDVIRTLEIGLALKEQIGTAPDPKKNKEGSGLLKKMYDIKEELGAFVASNGLDGIRHGKVVFTQRLQKGRSTTNPDKFVEFLAQHGVKAELVRAAVAYATEDGESFYVREITTI